MKRQLSRGTGRDRKSIDSIATRQEIIDKGKFYEREMTRLARMVLSQRQIYQSLKENIPHPGDYEGGTGQNKEIGENFWSAPMDLSNSYRADQRALLLLYEQVSRGKISIKGWLRQLVEKALEYCPEKAAILAGFESLKAGKKEEKLKLDRYMAEKENKKIADMNKKKSGETPTLSEFSDEFHSALSDFITE